MKKQKSISKINLVYWVKKYVWVFVIIISIVWGIGKNDPLGISNAADNKVNEGWIKWEEIFVPRKHVSSSTVVLMFDDKSFEAIRSCENKFFRNFLSSAWPLVYVDYANITNDLVEHGKARLIFWDVYFRGVRSIDPTWEQFLQKLEDIIFEKGQIVGFGFDLRVESDSPAIEVANSLVQRGVVLAPLNSFGTAAVYDVMPEIKGCEGRVCRQKSIPYAVKEMLNKNSILASKVLMSYPLSDDNWKCVIDDSCTYMSQKGFIPIYRAENLCKMDNPYGLFKNKVVLVGYDSSSDILRVPAYGSVPGVLYQARATELYLSGNRGLSDKVKLDFVIFSLTTQGIAHIFILIPIALFIVLIRKKIIYCCDKENNLSCMLIFMPLMVILIIVLIFFVRMFLREVLNEEILPIYTVSSFFILTAVFFEVSCKVSIQKVERG